MTAARSPAEAIALGYELGALVRYGKEHGTNSLADAVAEMDEDTTATMLMLALCVLCDDRLDEVWTLWGAAGPEELP